MATKKDIKASLVLAQKIREFVLANYGSEKERLRPRTPVDTSDQSFFEFVLPTTYGPLNITIHRGEPRWVFTNFEFPDKAKHLGCNPYSGKWNQYWTLAEPDQIAEMFTTLVEPMLMVPKHPIHVVDELIWQRRCEADKVFENITLPPIEALNGWEDDGLGHYQKRIFWKNSNGPSTVGYFYVHFKENSAEISSSWYE